MFWKCVSNCLHSYLVYWPILFTETSWHHLSIRNSDSFFWGKQYKEGDRVQTSSNLSYVWLSIRNLPSSRCISLFSSKLFRTGKTFLSAFSIPSSTRALPCVAARTALYGEQKQKKQQNEFKGWDQKQIKLSCIY